MATYMTRCTHCSEKLEVEEEWTGQNAICPRCKKEFTIQPKLGIKGKTSEGKAPISQGAPPPPENASKGLRPPKRRRRFFVFGNGFRTFVACLLIPAALAAAGYYAFLGTKEYLFENSGFHLAEVSDNTQIHVSGHGLFMKAEKNTEQQPPAPPPSLPSTWEESLNHSTPSQSYSAQVRQRNQAKPSIIKRIFSESYTGVLYLPEQNMTWGRLEAKNGKADGAFRIYRFRSGRETMTNEWLFKEGKLVKYTEFPRTGKTRIIYMHYDFLGRFTHAAEGKKVIAKAQYDKFSRLTSIVIQDQDYRLVQHYQNGKIVREERFKNKNFVQEVQYEYDDAGYLDLNQCRVFDANGRRITGQSRIRLMPHVELMKVFMKRRAYRRPTPPAPDMPEPKSPSDNTHELPPAPDGSSENHNSTYEQKPESVAERMARPATHPSADPNTAGSHAAKIENQKKK